MSNISLLKPLIIATESEIRKKIFSDFNLNVNFIASEVDEDSIKENFQFKNYYDLAIELASAKALEISKKNPALATYIFTCICTPNIPWRLHVHTSRRT